MEFQRTFTTTDKVERGSPNVILKIKSVLLKLISSEFKISDDTILQKLYDCISHIFSIEESHAPLLEIFLPWIDTVVKEWKIVNSKTCTFALRILSLICSNEKDFCRLLKSSVLPDVCFHVKNSEKTNFSLTLAYLELIMSITSYQYGCLWILENGIWREILQIVSTNRSLYALRKAQNVISNLIVSSAIGNLSACHCIIDEVFMPCFNVIKDEKNTVKALYIMHTIPYQKEYFQETLNYLNSTVLLRETILTMLSKKFTHSEIGHIFAKYNLTEWLHNGISNTENPRVMVELSRLLSALNISQLPHSENGKVNYSDMRIFCHYFLDHCKLLIKKKQFILIQEVCIDYFKLWNQYGGEIIFDVKEPDIDDFLIENSVFVILTLPLFVFVRLGQATKSDLMEAYAERIFGVACLQTQRTAYLLKHQFRECREKGEICVETLATSTVHRFIRIANVCKKEQGVMIFQTLVHILRKIIPEDFVDFPDIQNQYGMKDLQNVTISSPMLLSASLEALHCYISTFDFSWSDSLETLCIMPLLQRLLSSITTNLTPKMCADALKVQKVVLLGYLPTNLALRMNTLKGSSVCLLGKQIYRLLHSIHWEVRDSALELLQAICLLAEQKLPVFQEMLVDDDLPALLVSIFENDTEAYVRASALGCLCFMVKMQSVWDKALVNQSLIEKLLNAVVYDPEGIVRYKIMQLLREIYNCGRYRPEELDKMIDTLYHVTLTDLHWEVKCSAILFWDSVLEKKLADVGMVDGNFPCHIFSREKRKIIKLTPEETSSRIKQVFQSLSNFGCLHALWNIVQDDYDMEVTREAGKLITKMTDLLSKFNVPINTDSDMKFDIEEVKEQMKIDKNNLKRKLSSDDNENKSSIIHHKGQLNGIITSSDEVIESIVSEGDINLICGLIKRMDSKGPPKLLARTKLSLDEFHSLVVSYDILGKELEKARWLYKTSDGITSLLDDILAANEFGQDKNNVIDCY